MACPTFRTTTLATLAAAACGAFGAAGASAAEGSRFTEARAGRAAVASISPAASAAGIAVLEAGGNAMDAAVATTFAVGVTRPEYCGIGGGGFLVHRTARGATSALDFREEAPSDYTFTPGLLGGGTPLTFGTGRGVVGVPGTVAGMAAALERHGTIGLARAIEPARRLAAEGHVVSPEEARFSEESAARLRINAEAARTYLKDGLLPYRPGDRLILADYARSLELIAHGGAQAFYEGPIARAIVEDMQASGVIPGDRGTMTAADLAAYRAVWRTPLRTRYRGREVTTMPPPTSGGLALVQMLNVLEGYDLRRAGQSSATAIHLLAEAEKLAWADRAAYVADPDFVDVPVEVLAGKAYADRRRREIDPARARTYAPGLGDPPAPRATPRKGSHTTSVSVIDAAGNAVAVTCTIEQVFGSATVAPGTGFLLNNELTDFDAPGTPNEPRPGKRPRSSITPAIVAHRGRPVLAVGGAGGPSIIMGSLQAIVNTVDFGLDPGRAIDAERIDARGLCEGGGLQLCLEDARIAPGVVDELARRGHEVTRTGEYAPLPQTQAVGSAARGRWRLAAADPRGEDGAAATRAQRRPARGLGAAPERPDRTRGRW